jgi:O-antigen ligase
MVNYFGGIGDDANEFGAAMLALLPLPLLLFPTEKSVLKKGLLAAIALAMLLCIIRTRSRGAFLGLLAMAPLLFWDMRRRFGQMLLAVLMLSYAVANTHSGYWERMATAFSEDAIEEDFSASSRLHQQRAAGELLKRRPFFGVGPGNFVFAKIRLLGEDPAHRMTYLAPHNAYLGLGVEIGIPGLLLLLATMLVTFRSLGRSAQTVGPPEDEPLRRIAKAVRIGLVGLSVAVFFLTEQYNSVLYMWFAMSAALQSVLQPERSATVRAPARAVPLRTIPLVR